MLQKHLLNLYHNYSATDNYILGFTFNGLIYSYICKDKELNDYVTLSRESSKKGGSITLRFRPKKDDKINLLLKGATIVCSKNHFDNLVTNSKYNKGEIFEQLITEINGQIWKKDSVPFWQSGDLKINNIDYQLKFEGATFASEKTLLKLGYKS